VEGAEDVAAANEEVVEGREGRLGEMPGKRKRAEIVTTDQPDETLEDEEVDGEDEDVFRDEDDFESFDDDDDAEESEDKSQKVVVETT
jgi:nuclear GTP-binding protein